MPTLTDRDLSSFLEGRGGTLLLCIDDSIQPSLFACIDSAKAHERLHDAEMSLLVAQVMLQETRKKWPDGEDIYQRFDLAISEITKHRQYVEAILSVAGLDIPPVEKWARTQEIVHKDREAMMIADTYVAEAVNMLNQQAGIRVHWIWRERDNRDDFEPRTRRDLADPILGAVTDLLRSFLDRPLLNSDLPPLLDSDFNRSLLDSDKGRHNVLLTAFILREATHKGSRARFATPASIPEPPKPGSLLAALERAGGPRTIRVDSVLPQATWPDSLVPWGDMVLVLHEYPAMQEWLVDSHTISELYTTQGPEVQWVFAETFVRSVRPCEQEHPVGRAYFCLAHDQSVLSLDCWLGYPFSFNGRYKILRHGPRLKLEIIGSRQPFLPYLWR